MKSSACMGLAAAGLLGLAWAGAAVAERAEGRETTTATAQTWGVFAEMVGHDSAPQMAPAAETAGADLEILGADQRALRP